jgi:hypothetical protein
MAGIFETADSLEGNDAKQRALKTATILQLIGDQKAAEEKKAGALNEALQARLAARASGVDVTPVAAFLDSSFGTKIAPAAAQSAQQQAGYDQKTDQLFSELQAAKSSSKSGELLRLLNSPGPDKENQARLGAQDTEAKDMKAFKDVKDEQLKKRNSANDYLIKFGQIDDALNSRDPRRIIAQSGSFASLGGNKGATSDPDAERAVMKDVNLAFELFATKIGGNGEVADEDIQYLKDSINSARQKFADKIQLEAETDADQYKANPTYGRVVESIKKYPNNPFESYKKIGQQMRGSAGNKSPKAPAKGAAKNSVPSMSEIEAELARRGGG